MIFWKLFTNFSYWLCKAFSWIRRRDFPSWKLLLSVNFAYVLTVEILSQKSFEFHPKLNFFQISVPNFGVEKTESNSATVRKVVCLFWGFSCFTNCFAMVRVEIFVLTLNYAFGAILCSLLLTHSLSVVGSIFIMSLTWRWNVWAIIKSLKKLCSTSDAENKCYPDL